MKIQFSIYKGCHPWSLAFI